MATSAQLTDNAAAERYTECKLTEYTWDTLLADSGVWQTKPSYDGSFQEPIEFNVKVPQVLINGAEGIAVGFATRIPNHNLRGVAKALRFLVEGDTKNGAKHLIPDFPTGCEVVKDEGLLEYMQTGRGSFRMRALCETEEIVHGKRSKRTAFTFTNLPLHVSTEQLGDQVKAGLEKGNITWVADVRDESDLSGTRFVVILKANADVEQAKAELYRYTSLDTKFSANNLVIDGTKPVQLAPYDVLSRWLAWRDETLVRIFTSELEVRRSRLEIIQGLISALDMIDDVIDTIRRSKDKATARTNLIKRDFTEAQANAILDMRLSQLTKLDDKTLRAEGKEVQARIKELLKLNSNKNLRSEYILDEVDELALRYGNARRSKVVAPPTEAAIAVVKQGRKKIEVGPKPRFIQVDEKKGILTQERKMSRKSWVVQSSDKLIFVCDNGMFVKKPATAKGPLFDAPVGILFRAKTSSLPNDPLLAVFKLDGNVYANTMTWDSLTKCTSKGKTWLPDGAELIHLGGSYIVEKAGRKKNVELRVAKSSQRTIGGKGTKVCNASDLA